MFISVSIMSAVNRQEQRTQATKAKLLAIARKLFVAQGFNHVPAEELVRQAGLTRGALYHHFGGKEQLFIALYEQLQKEIAERIQVAAETAADPWSALQVGCHAFLTACTDPEVRQIVLLDAPSVLSWQQWREVDAQYSLGLLKAGLQAAVENQEIRVKSVDAIAHLLTGAMNEAALWIAQSEKPKTALSQSIEAIDQLLTGIRTQAIK
jgi:AcrR family transcriptional regulator